MSIDRTRFARQIALPELGLDGQTRLAEVPVSLARFSSDAVALHLRAGGAVASDGLDVTAALPDGEGPCVSLGLGALGAVEAARRVLGEAPCELPDLLMKRLLP